MSRAQAWLRRPRTLAATLATLMTTVLVLSVAAGIAVAIAIGRATLSAERVQVSRDAAATYASAVRFYVAGARSALESAAALRDIQSAVIAAGDDVDARRPGRAAAFSIVQHSAVFDYVVVIGRDGWVRLVEPANLEARQFRSDRGYATWFTDVVRSGATVYSDLVLSPVTQRPTVMVAVPIRDGSGVVTGVLAGSLRLDELSKMGSEHPAHRDAAGFVTDRRGLVIAHQVRPEYVASQTDLRSLPPVREALAGGAGAGRFYDPVERLEQIGAWVRIPETGWAVVHAEPLSAALAALTRLTWTLIAAAVAIAGVLGAASLLFARRLVDPLRRLTRAAEGLEAGGPVEHVVVDGPVEIARLADTFNRMAATVAEQERALRERAQALEAAASMSRRVQTITDAVLADLPLDELLGEVLARVRATLQTDVVVILLRTEQELRARAAIGLEEEVESGLTIRVGQGFAGKIASDRQPLVWDEVDYAQVASPWIPDKGIRSLAGVPLLTEEGLLGVLCVGSAPPRHFSDEEIQLLQLAAERIAFGIERAARRDAERRARDAADAANHAKDQFLAMLGHELRNPLGAIASAVGVLSLAGSDQETAEHARAVIGRQVQHLSRLVDDLLDVSRVTTGKVRLNRQPLDLGDLVASSMNVWRTAGRFGQHVVSVDVSSVWIDADETRIEQILGNLVGNALKYTPVGGSVAVSISQEGQEALIEVADTGAGIPPSQIAKIFDLFVQGDRALDRAQGGLGIGLTVVKALAEMHGGTVEARSAGAGKGSVFTVRVPRVPAPAPSPPAVTSTIPTGASHRILVIEDNDDAREMLRVMLTLAGHKVYAAADGRTGVTMATDLYPDVVLIDVGLPGIDGYEVARRIRASEGGRSVRLIATTGYGQAEDVQRALDAGFDAHLTKPVTPERLAALIA